MSKSKDRNRILKAAGSKKEFTYEGKPLRFATDLSNETLSQKRIEGYSIKTQ